LLEGSRPGFYGVEDLTCRYPPEKWLPINRQDEVLAAGLRIYVPDPEAFQDWTAPKVEKLVN
jgi:hypothetical protein